MGGAVSRRDRLRAIFEELIGAYGRKDFDRFGQHVAEDAVFEWPYLPLKEFPERMVGRDAFIAMSREGMADCDGYNHRVSAFYDQLDPDMLIVEYHSQTVLRSTGTPYANRYLGILRFTGDLVSFWKEYVNPLAIIDAYGLDYNNAAVTA